MKSIVNKMVAVLMVGALTSVVAFAKVHKSRVNFETDIKVNGTLVKKGNYEVRFDDESGQLSIVKNGKTIAQASAKVEQRDKKAEDFQLRSSNSGNELQLTGVTFGGSDKDIMITGSGGSSSTGNLF